MSDTEIIEGFLRGESVAHDVLLGWVREVVRARLWVETVSADDIVSDTICKLLLNFRAKKFAHESSLKTYAQRITRFTIIDSIRSHQRAKRLEQEASRSGPDGRTPLEILEAKEEIAIYHRVFSLIDERCKELWYMIFTERLPYKEIARRLETTEEAIKTRIFRCKEEAIEIRTKIS